MRKLFNWYNALQVSGNLKVKEAEAAEESTEKKIVKAATEKKAAVKKTTAKEPKAKTSVGVKKTAGVRKTGSA